MAAGDERGVGNMPDRDEVILTAGENVRAVGRPADADEPAIVGVEVVEESGMVVSTV